MQADNQIYKRAKKVELLLMRQAFLTLSRDQQEQLRSMIEVFDLEISEKLQDAERVISSPEYATELVNELVSHHGKQGAKARLREMKEDIERNQLTQKVNHAWKEKFGIK